MTIQSMLLLRKLKKAQISETEDVYIDFDKLTASTVHDSGAPYQEVSLSQYASSLSSVLNYLQSEGMIQISGPFDEYIKVCHLGWHSWQRRLTRLGKFLASSIVIPIAVSAVTTLITLWITSLFK